MNRLIKFIFFGNIFYGICAVALSVEASMQQGFPLNDSLFYVLIFLVTVLYYNVAYITEKPSLLNNPRSLWYARNIYAIKLFQRLLTFVFLLLLGLFLTRNWEKLLIIDSSTWGLLLVFPLAAALYYGINHKSVGRLNLRDIGWMKPFIIGFSWAGLVTVFPVVYYSIIQGIVLEISLFGILLFIKNFMFISLLCILFDIKDYATDYNQQLKTFVVKAGLRKTIFYIIIPLAAIGWGCFLLYGLMHNFGFFRLIVNTLPFLSLIAVAYSLHRRRSIFYYLVIIDGLMLFKALCGMFGMLV